MPTALTALALGAFFALAPHADALALLPGSLALLAAGLALGSLCHGRLDALGLTAGALGALAFALLSPTSTSLACAVALALWWAPRALRARSKPSRPAVLGAALAAGAVGALVLDRFAHGATLSAVSGLVVGVLACAPLLVPADDATAFELLQCAHESEEPARSVLLRAVVLRRKGDEALASVPSRVRGRVRDAWSTLCALGRASATQRKAHERVLERLTSHVEVLERLYAAAESRAAHLAGLEDSNLRHARAEGDDLEAEARALGELDAAASAAATPAATATPATA